MKKIQDYIVKKEFYFFTIIVAFSLFPLFATSTFPVSDAPSHMYNAGLIKQMAVGHNAFLAEYLSFNPRLVPNWTGHFILSALLIFFSTETTEKIILVLIFAGLPFAVRYCINGLLESKAYFSYLSIPLAYNCYSGIGFYNFSLGLIFAFIVLGFFIRILNNKNPSWYHYLLFFFLFLSTYLSHIVAFSVACLSMATMYVWWAVACEKTTGWRKWVGKKIIFLIVSGLPVLFLSLRYLLETNNADTSFLYLENDELFEYFWGGKCFVVFGNHEAVWAGALVLLYFAVSAASLHEVFAKFGQNGYKHITFYLMLLILFFLLMYIKLPDGDGKGAYFSMRLVIITLLFIVLFASVSPLKPTFSFLIILLALLIDYKRLDFYREVNVINNSNAKLTLAQAKYVEDNSFIVPIDHSNNWLYGSFVDYLCYNKAVINLNNYECNTNFFPLIWKNERELRAIYDSLITFKGMADCKRKLSYRTIYYWISGRIEDQLTSEYDTLRNNLKNNCILINSNNFASLYKLR